MSTFIYNTNSSTNTFGLVQQAFFTAASGGIYRGITNEQPLQRLYNQRIESGCTLHII